MAIPPQQPRAGWQGLACRRHHRNERLAARFLIEFNVAIDNGEDRMIFAKADAFARVPFRAALANNNVARGHGLTPKFLYAQTTAG